MQGPGRACRLHGPRSLLHCGIPAPFSEDSNLGDSTVSRFADVRFHVRCGCRPPAPVEETAPGLLKGLLMKSFPVVIVWAAGRGGGFEAAWRTLAQPFGASTVLGTTLAQVDASGLPLVVVSSAALRELAQDCTVAADVVTLPQAPEGEAEASMGRSIAAGVLARSEAPGWLVLPADMPMVQPHTLRAVASAMEAHPVTYAQYRGRRGHPVAFSGELYSELSGLCDDRDVRRLLARYPAAGIEVDDRGVLLDASPGGARVAMRRPALAPLPPRPHGLAPPS